MKRTTIALLLISLAAFGADKGTVLRSIVLPGWGQFHAGHSTRGTIFMGLEASIWTGVGISYLQGIFSRDDYRNLAMEEAGIDVSSRDRSFQDDVGDFSSSQEYNDYIRSLARYYYPDDPDARGSISRTTPGSVPTAGAGAVPARGTTTPMPFATAENGSGEQPMWPPSPW